MWISCTQPSANPQCQPLDIHPKYQGASFLGFRQGFMLTHYPLVQTCSARFWPLASVSTFSFLSCSAFQLLFLYLVTCSVSLLMMSFLPVTLCSLIWFWVSSIYCTRVLPLILGSKVSHLSQLFCCHNIKIQHIQVSVKTNELWTHNVILSQLLSLPLFRKPRSTLVSKQYFFSSAWYR